MNGSCALEDLRPRVLIAGFTVVPASSADATALLAAARALAHRCEVDIVSIKTDALPHMEMVGRARVLRVPLGVGGRPERAAAFRRALRRQLEGEPYDVVHVRGALECLVALERKPAGTPFRLVYDMGAFPSEDDGPGAERAWSQAHARACVAADAVIAPSSAARDALRLPDERVAVIEPGVDIDQFDWERPSSSKAVCVLYLGPYASDRDMPTLVSAARLLARPEELKGNARGRSTARPDVRWLLAGEVDASRRSRVREMVASFGLDGVIDVRGEPDVQALPLVIASADICVVPAAPVARYLEHGDIPQPLLEYLACRRPVVVANVPGVSQLVRHEVEGLHYEAASEESLAAQLRALIEDEELRRALAEAGYRRARDDYNDAARRRRFLTFYQRLLDLEAAPPWGWFVADPSGVVSIGSGGTNAGVDPEGLRSDLTLIGELPAADPVAESTPLPVKATSADTAEIELPDADAASVLSVDTGAHRLPELARAPASSAHASEDKRDESSDTGRVISPPEASVADTGPHHAPGSGPHGNSDTGPHAVPDTGPHRAPDTGAHRVADTRPHRVPDAGADTGSILAPEDLTDGAELDES